MSTRRGFAMAGCLCLVASVFSSAQEAPIAITGGRLIDGFGGTPLENAVVILEGERITAVGREGEVALPSGARIVDANGTSVLPGLWESHGHLAHVGEGNPTEFLYDFQGSEGMKFADRMIEIMATIAEVNLMAGVTSFRDTGGPLAEQTLLRDDIDAGRRVGPRLYLAGPILNQGARNPAPTEGSFHVNSPDEGARIVRELVADGANQIKVYGFWDLEILEAIVSEAHANGVGVDADVRHIEAYTTAVAAGVDRLHHVFVADALSGYSDEELRMLVRGVRPSALGPSGNILRGPYILPTIEMRRSYVRVLSFPEMVDHPRLKTLFDADVYEWLRETWERPQSVPWGIGAPNRVDGALRKLRGFIEAGGKEQIVAGTDAGTPFNFHPPLPREIENLVDAGLTPMEAIQAATLRAAQMQGVENELGTIAPGMLADVIVVDGDPLDDISLLRTAVAHVFKNGTMYR